MLKVKMTERFIEALEPADNEYIIANLTEQERNTLFSIYDEARCYVNALTADGCTDESEYCKTYQRICGILMWLDSTDKLFPSQIDALGDLALDMCIPDEIFGKTERMWEK